MREVIFEVIMTKFPELIEDVSLQIENSFQFMNRINNIKSTFRHIEVKLWNIAERKIPQGTGQKPTTHHKKMESTSS